ncbi:MAG: DNA polymerase IV [Acidobacteriota bacterium]|nr:MAG: DNA polymerase IV [Acidobacteriota bacterium]
MDRVIFHVDMDAFYASVEQRDTPAYIGRPVIVGADPRGGAGRGVVAACSYEARRYGIHSALPISQAYRLCPDGVYLRPDMAKYSRVSREIREIFKELTPLIEPLSIDEAFLDVSGLCADEQAALALARDLKSRIRKEQQLTASVGVAPSKFVAKIASDLEKPDGLVLVTPRQLQRFLDPLPLSRIWGVGPRTEERLKAMNLETIGDLRRFDVGVLERRFGKHGGHLWRLANGIDPRPVVVSRKAKSVSQERTFSTDTKDREVLDEVLKRLSHKVAERLKRHAIGGKTVTIKLRYSDFTTLTRQASFRDVVSEGDAIYGIAARLLKQYWETSRAVRLIGVGLSALESSDSGGQLRLFD